MHRLFRDQLSHKTCLSIWFWLKSSFTNQWLEANTLQKDYLWPEISNTTLTQSHLESLRHIDFQCVSSLTVPLVVSWEDLVFGYCILIRFFLTEFNCTMTDLILINKGIFEFVCVSIIDRFVFCFSAPSLTTLCKLCILENKIDVSSLPKTIRWVQFLLDSVSETMSSMYHVSTEYK